MNSFQNTLILHGKEATNLVFDRRRQPPMTNVEDKQIASYCFDLNKLLIFPFNRNFKVGIQKVIISRQISNCLDLSIYFYINERRNGEFQVMTEADNATLTDLLEWLNDIRDSIRFTTDITHVEDAFEFTENENNSLVNLEINLATLRIRLSPQLAGKLGMDGNWFYTPTDTTNNFEAYSAHCMDYGVQQLNISSDIINPIMSNKNSKLPDSIMDTFALTPTDVENSPITELLTFEPAHITYHDLGKSEFQAINISLISENGNYIIWCTRNPLDFVIILNFKRMLTL